jgi:hypothetical protein
MGYALPRQKNESVRVGLAVRDTEPPIIDIDDIDDPREELLNITDPTADISHFFTLAPCVPGQPKTRMKCESCV